MKKHKLLIISHTEHFYNETGQIVGWGPTINEINYLSNYFTEVIHVACLHNYRSAPNSALRYTNSNIKFVPIPPFGGKGLKKLSIFYFMLRIIKVVNRNLENSTHVQLRLPTGIGVFLLPYFAWFKKRSFLFWVKYAGNWAESNPPMGYAFQRWFLKKNFLNCNVTINGFWADQPKHCLSFENPCISEEQFLKGRFITKTKLFNGPYKFLFIGRLEDEKGVQTIINCFKNIDLNIVESLTFIGDGKNKEHYIRKSEFLHGKVQFLGPRNTVEIHELLVDAHFLLLPSTASEGFPKVIAEALCYGVIPIVSEVGSIKHYINDSNGFVLDINNIESNLLSVFDNFEDKLSEKRQKFDNSVVVLFTFKSYYQKLLNMWNGFK